jgi:uncharacterized protein DUF262/uncharacterized protein DUF1524
LAQKTPAMSAASVKPTSLPVSELMSARYPARVPRYQRAYAWDDDHVNDLINDVRLLLPTRSGTRGHFYGGMVAISVPDSSEPGGHTYEIVDGQQRLATFCLLLAQIAVRADELESVARAQGKQAEGRRLGILARDIRNTFLYYQRYDVDKGVESREPRVRLSLADDEIFRALLEGSSVTPSRDSHRLLQQSSDLLREELVQRETMETDPAKARKSLQRLRDAVLLDSFVIHIVGDSRSSGYRLFAVLNDRGARLTVADLLRSHTLEILDTHAGLRDKSASLWDDILTEGSDAVDEFLMTYYTSLTGKRAKRDDLFDEIKELLFPSESPSQSVLDTLKSMATELRAFMFIHKGDWPYDSAEQVQSVTNWQRSRLSRLVSMLRHELSTPLLLAARARCSEEQFAELVHMLEIFAFRYKNVCGVHAGPASASYYAECKHLRDPKATVNFSTLRKSLQGLINKRASDAIFSNALKDQLSYDAGSAAKTNIRHLLTVIEDYRPWVKQGASGKPKPSMLAITDLGQVTIEHIHAQNAKQPDPDLDPRVSRLGNLSYWGPDDNSAAGNLPFADKKAAYAASSVTLNHDLATLPVWDLAAFEAREEQLIKEACLIFTI